VIEESGSSLPGVEQSTASDEVVSRVLAHGSSLVVLPRSQSDDGKAVYSEASLHLVKELREAGYDAGFLDGSANRLFEVKKGDLAVLGVILLGIASSAGWDGIKWLVRSIASSESKPKKLELTIVRADNATSYHLQGRPSDVLDAIEAIGQLGRDDSGSD
jgi:hypothetical protein